MAETVWCVLQKLPGEQCPTLSAVCRSAAVADALVALSREEERSAGNPPSEWIIHAWTVLDEEPREIADVDQISHVLDPMRAALAAMPGSDEAEAEAATE